MLRRVALVRINVSEVLRASILRVTRIGELRITLAVTSNRRTLRRNTKSYNVQNLFVYWTGVEPSPLILRPLIGLLYQLWMTIAGDECGAVEAYGFVRY
jgi:hypothetical protein